MNVVVSTPNPNTVRISEGDRSIDMPADAAAAMARMILVLTETKPPPRGDASRRRRLTP
jgi:hypothetical protein